MKTKKIGSVPVIIAMFTLIFVSCVSVPEGVGDGSETGYVMKNATLPDGSKADMHLFKTQKEASMYFKENTSGKWYMKHEGTAGETLKMSGKNFKISEDDLYIMPCTVEELGEIGKVMFDKGLPFAIVVQNRGTEIRQTGISIFNDWKSARFFKNDFIDESTYTARVEVKRAKEKEESERRSKERKELLGKMLPSKIVVEDYTSTANPNQGWNNSGYRQSNTSGQSSSTGQRQTQHISNSTNHAKNKSDLEMWFNKYANEESARNGNPLNRTTSSVVSSKELEFYESLIASGESSGDAAWIVYLQYRKKK